jgi:uncharacterized damage-inducible protein DinB
MTSSEPQDAIRRATERFIEAFAGVTSEQWTLRPKAGDWSMSEATEHVAIANEGILTVVSKYLNDPLTEPLGVTDEDMPYLFYRDGDEPPEIAKPTGTWIDAARAAKDLEATAQTLIQWAQNTDLDLRARGCVHPAFGLMDGVQWLLFAATHTERHRAQILSLRRRSLAEGGAGLAARGLR